MARRFELIAGKSNKFWQVSTSGNTLTVRFGRIGTDGQEQTKTFASADGASEERDRLVREKSGKGYIEVKSSDLAPKKRPAAGAKGTTPPRAPSTRTAPPKAPSTKTTPGAKPFVQCDPDARDKLAAKHWPNGISSDPAMRELFRRGWPFLRILTDAGAGKGKGKGKGEALAKKHIEATDPVLHVEWPRDAAKFVLESWGTKDKGVARADRIIATSTGTTGRRRFEWEDVIFLLENELGTDVVAERIVHGLEKMTAGAWDDDNPHTRILSLVFCLECLMLRSTPSMSGELAERIRALIAKRKKTTLIAQRLLITIEGDGAVKGSGEDYTALCHYLTTDARLLKRLLKTHPSWRIDPQLLYVFGANLLTPAHVAPMRRDPRWKQAERKIFFGPIEHEAIQQMLGGQAKSVAAKKQLSERDLDREVTALIKALVADVKKVRGKRAAEEKTFTRAVHKLIELRAAAGHATPEERIGHILGVDGWGKQAPAFELLSATDAERDRWADVIDAASE